jgi:hypothetical protein
MFERNSDQYKNGLFTWFIGEVKDISDTREALNRVRVLAYGYYDGVTDKNQNGNSSSEGPIPKEEEDWSDLPWATVMMPTTSASLKGVGGNHHLEVGSWVIGFFRDGPSAQDPIVIGSIATSTDGVRDIPAVAASDPVNNKVYQSKAGHLIEIDNKDGAEQIRITHKSGSFIKFLEDGTIQIKSSLKTQII